jgi:hypothetical protein
MPLALHMSRNLLLSAVLVASCVSFVSIPLFGHMSDRIGSSVLRTSLAYLEITDPVLPIYVNAYLPPQPSIERCYAFGQALALIVSAMGMKRVVLASGGMSHYPGTERYAAPDLAWDREALARIAVGNLKSLTGYDAAELRQRRQCRTSLLGLRRGRAW